MVRTVKPLAMNHKIPMENVVKVEIPGYTIDLYPKSNPARNSVWLDIHLDFNCNLDLKAIMTVINQ